MFKPESLAGYSVNPCFPFRPAEKATNEMSVLATSIFRFVSTSERDVASGFVVVLLAEDNHERRSPLLGKSRLKRSSMCVGLL